MKRFTLVLTNASDCAPRSTMADLDEDLEARGGLGGADQTIEHFSGIPRAPEQSFVGRDQALSELNLAIVRSLQGRGSLVLISGEPGIGKTRLMAEFAGLAQRAGVVSLWGNCWEGGEAPVFWPWTQVLRAYGRTQDARVVQQALGTAAVELQSIVPELTAHAGVSSVTSVTSVAASPSLSHEARFRLFDAVAGFLRRASETQPLLINLDNLHAADEGSLQLLRFVATDLWDARVLLLASYRESDATSDTPLWRLLGQLGPNAQRIQLLGLGPDDVAQLIRELGGVVPEPEFSRALHARTQGNPFFVREVLRLHASGAGALEGVPDSVAQVIERRLSRVRPEALEVLHGAAVFGAEFSIELLVAMSDLAPDEVQAVLPALLSSRLLARDRTADEYRFAHALVREVCYAQLPELRRRELHRRAASAIAAQPGADARAAEIAFHAMRAGGPEDLRWALECSEKAAQQARRVGALEDATQHLERALELALVADQARGASASGAAPLSVSPAPVAVAASLGDRSAAPASARDPRPGAVSATDSSESAMPPSAGDRRSPSLPAGGRSGNRSASAARAPEVLSATRRRCELLLELGSVQMARGLLPLGQKTFARAAELAQACGDVELLARAALGYGVEFGAGGSDEQEVALLEAALAALQAEESSLRARVMSRLSRALLFGVRHAERVELAEQALATARRLGDRATLASVLYARHQSLWTGAPAEARCAIADEIVQLAEACGDRELAMQARALRLGDLLELAALDRYRVECASYARLVRDENAVTSAWHVPMQQATLAMLSGQFEEAERLGAEGLALGRRITHQGIEVFHHSVLMTIRYLQGRHAELLPVLRHGADAYPTLPVFRAGLALAHAERGERLEARLVFERLAGADFRDVPRDILWVFNLALLSITAHFLGDAPRARQLYGWLEPYASYNVRVTRIGISSIGSAQHYLGLLAAAFGDLDRAADHFERAAASHRAQGAVAILANSELQLARVLEQRGAKEDGSRASEARSHATGLAKSLGIRLVLAELDETISPLMAAATRASSAATAPSGAPGSFGAVDGPAARIIRFRREGADWVIEQSTGQLRWRSAVGMEMLARLLREPGREFSALELRGSDLVGSDSGEMLDAQATQSYRDRAAELRESIAQAEQMNDVGRAESARKELERLEQELRRAIGLGGRVRRAGATYERARISVTKAIRAALKKISEQDAELGAHLERSVKTGQLCVFSPDPTADVRWEVE